MTAITTADQLAARIELLDGQVQELTQRNDQALPGTAPGSDPEEPVRLRFPDVESWVNGLFLPMFTWRVDGQRWFWCPQWWRHAEAIWRLELLWRSWEAARLRPTGMSPWSIELDRHLRELLGDEGPFRQCRPADGDRPARHVDPDVAIAQPAPTGWWE
jgi:hypothetical protein